MTDEQKELYRRAECGIESLKSWLAFMLRKGESDMTKMLQVVIDDYETILKEWTFAIGHPQEISPKTVNDIFQAVTRIVNEKIKDKTF